MSFLTSLRPTLRSPLPLPLPTRLLPRRPFATSPAPRLARMTIIGRLAESPEIVSTSVGQDVVRYALATSSGPKDHRQTSWWKVACFLPEGAARTAVMTLGKGSLLCVEGDCRMNQFHGKDGSAQTALSIVQRNFEILDKREPTAEEHVEEQIESE